MAEIFPILVLVFFVAFIYLIANWAQRNRENEEAYIVQTTMSFLILIGIYLVLFVVGASLHITGISLQASDASEISEVMPGIFNDDLDLESIASRLPFIGLGFWLPSLLGLLLLLPAVRRMLARLIHIDAGSPVHAVTLSISMTIFLQLLVTLGIGLENLAATLSLASEAAGESNEMSTIGALWVQQLGMAFIGLIGVGWLLRRNWSASLRRLGISPLTANQLIAGIGIGIGMVPVVMLLEAVSRELLGIGIDPGVEALTEELLGSLIQTPLGILTIGLSAAIGEETLFRGAAQPRLGIILTSVLFALVHSNYGLSISTVIVFALGLVLGYIRLRHNTSMAMVIHAVYNTTLGLLAYLSIPFLE